MKRDKDYELEDWISHRMQKSNTQKAICYDCVSFEMKNKPMVSQSILWATALLVVALVDDKQYTLFLLALLATVSVANLNKNS